MRFSILLLIVLTLSNPIFSQNKISDSLTLVNKKSTNDSLALKKQDSIPYATLYFYRSYIPKFNAPIKKIPLYVNDSLVYKLKANMMIALKVFKEGKFNIAIDEKAESEIAIKVKFGKEYFFKCEVVKGLWFGKPAIETVTTAVGKAESGMLKSE